MISQIKSRKRIANHGEVFTAPREVNAMLDLLPASSYEIEKRFFEPACGTGNFLVEILRRKFERVKSNFELNQNLSNSTLKSVASIYAIDIKEDNVAESRNRLLEMCTDFFELSIGRQSDAALLKYINFILRKNIIHGDALADKDFTTGGSIEFCSWNGSKIEYSHSLERLQSASAETGFFHAVVGNPPYQQSDGGAAASAIPIYHLFHRQAVVLKPQFISLIIPSRWFTSGKGLDGFREEMLGDTRLKELVDFHNARHCFPEVEIKGGVCYFLWDKNHDGPCKFTSVDSNGSRNTANRFLLEPGRDIFIRYNLALPILEKVEEMGLGSFRESVSIRKPFGLATNFQASTERENADQIKIYANHKILYTDPNCIFKNADWISKYKVLVPYAVGSGNPKTDVLKPILAPPGTACTETYLVIGPFDSKAEAQNAISYINTKFFHFMLTLRKNTQHATRKVYDYVPAVDLSKSWNDEQLCQYFQLNNAEQKFINSLISDRIPLTHHG
jgi:site-specific DNA-methyltransferase (adenine-specific)